MSAPRITYYYVRPTDSLFVRGNLAFGDAGEHGTGMMPPPPSLLAGAFRSALLGQEAQHLDSFLAKGQCSDAALHACLGTPTQPGAFRVSWVSLAGEPAGSGEDGNGAIEAISSLPADVLMLGNVFAQLLPRTVATGVQSAGDLPLRATLASAKQEKPTGGIYLRHKGLERHLRGELPEAVHKVEARHLHRRDPRLGIGLDNDARTADEGLIYTTEGYAFSPKGAFTTTGFLVGLEGVADVMPESGTLRLGGDGRSAAYQRVHFEAPTMAAPANQRFRLILQTPALFEHGWLPTGVAQQDDGDQQTYRLQGQGFSARLACAALGRREMVSGWDLFEWKPKPAQAAVPAGSVYWFDQFQGDFGKLAAWVSAGLWPNNAAMSHTSPAHPYAARRAEGYNCALLGAWNK